MVYLIVFLPLLGSILSGFWGRKLGDKFSMYLTSSFLILSMLFGWVEFIKLSNKVFFSFFSLKKITNKEPITGINVYIEGC